jgi:hypothetical protein
MFSSTLYSCLVLLHLAAVVRLTNLAGAVPLRHVIFVVLSSVYAVLANLVAPASARVTKDSLTRRPRVVRWLFPFTAVLSIALPWWFLLGDPFRRPAPALIAVDAGQAVPTALARVIAPHLFLVHAQLLVETFSFFLSVRITAYVRISLPIAYVSYRLPVIFQWWKDAAAYLPSESGTDEGKMLRLLAVCNGIFWAFGLFGFLLPYVLSYFFVEPDVDTEVLDCQPDPGLVRRDEATKRNMNEVASSTGRLDSANTSTPNLRLRCGASPIL